MRDARFLRDDARRLLAQGIDPRAHRKQRKVEGFGEVKLKEFVHDWLAFKLKKLHVQCSPERKNEGASSTLIQIERYLRLDILPLLGNQPMNGITRADLLAVQARIEARGALSIAEKVRGWLRDIFAYTVGLSVVEFNPAVLMDVVALPYRRNHHNPYLSLTELPELIEKLQHYRGSRQTQLGIKLLLLTGVRTGELRFATPDQFDLNEAVWHVRAKEDKRLRYIVPLPRQAVRIIEELVSNMFPNQRYLLCHRIHSQEAISENTLNSALKRLGFEGRLTGQGIRETILRCLERLGYKQNFIDAQLSYRDLNKVRHAYNHAQYLEPRRLMMQQWADKFDRWALEGTRSGS